MENKNEHSSILEDEKRGILLSPLNLLNTIKSRYIFGKIVSILAVKIKLNLFIYNKKIKNKLGINLDDYKKISGKEFIGDRNGEGKEYKLGTEFLIFEGKYLKGKKNGKGKEYYLNGKLKFEGEYLNGIKIEGKGYDEEDNLILEIKSNGKGEEKYKN